MKTYKPGEYWEQRLSQDFDLSGVGHKGLSLNYNIQLYNRRLEVLKSILSQAKIDISQSRVLEIGCGNGFYTQFFTQHQVREYVGIDITSISIDNLQQQFPDHRFVCADISELDVSHMEGKFDIVFAADVRFHIVDDEKFKAAIRNVACVLRSGGLLIISDILPQETTQTALHVRLRSKSEYSRLFQENSLTTRYIEPIFVISHPSPTYGQHLLWNVITVFWKLLLRVNFKRLSIADSIICRSLLWLDRKFLCPKYGQKTPNSKYTFAYKQ